MQLFPYPLRLQAEGQRSGHHRVQDRGNLRQIKDKIQSGYNLREIIDHIDELRFRSQTEKHELSHLYEAKIKNMGNAERNGGEYYTTRPVIRAMVQVVGIRAKQIPAERRARWQSAGAPCPRMTSRYIKRHRFPGTGSNIAIFSGAADIIGRGASRRRSRTDARCSN